MNNSLLSASSPSPKRQPNLPSLVWLFMSKCEDKDGVKYAKCQLCSKTAVAKFTIGTTTSMRYHLQKVHPKEWVDEEARREMVKNDVVERIEELDPKDKAFKNDTLLTLALCESNISINQLKCSERWNAWFKANNITLPGRKRIKTIKDCLIDTLEEQIRDSLTKIDERSISSDAYSSQKHPLNFNISIIHYLDANGCKRDAVLALNNLEGRTHTVANITHDVCSVLENFNLAEKTQFFVADGAGANTNAAINLNLPRIYCFAHLVHNAVKRFREKSGLTFAVEKTRSAGEIFSRAIEKIRYLVRSKQKLFFASDLSISSHHSLGSPLNVFFLIFPIR